MTATAAEPRLSPEFRTSVFYFTQFMSGGAANAFGGIWFASKGISPAEIGIINAMPMLLMLTTNLLVGRVADRASDWRQVIIVGAVAASVLPIGLFFVSDFWGVLIFWSLAVSAQALVVPVADAAAMRITRRRGSDFGAIRAWATIGYLIIIFATGYLTLWLGGEVFLPLFVGLALVRAAAAFGLPRFRAPKAERLPTVGATRLLQTIRPWFVLPLVGWAMVNACHWVLNGFQALLFKEQGIPPDVIGILIGIGAIAETAMFFGFRRFAGRYTARNLLILSAAVAVFRWTAMAFSPGVPILVGLQLLHSVTYALGFLGCMNFIANWTSEDIAAEAQSFFVVIQEAMAIIALLTFGWLAGFLGAEAYFASAAFSALGCVLIWVSKRLQQPKAASEAAATPTTGGAP